MVKPWEFIASLQLHVLLATSTRHCRVLGQAGPRLSPILASQKRSLAVWSPSRETRPILVQTTFSNTPTQDIETLEMSSERSEDIKRPTAKRVRLSSAAPSEASQTNIFFSGACERCREKKIKCDVNTPRCSACVKNDSDCVMSSLVNDRRYDRK